MNLKEAKEIIEGKDSKKSETVKKNVAFYRDTIVDILGDLGGKLDISTELNPPRDIASSGREGLLIFLEAKDLSWKRIFTLPVVILVPYRYIDGTFLEVARAFSYTCSVSRGRWLFSDCLDTRDELSVAEFLVFVAEHFGLK